MATVAGTATVCAQFQETARRHAATVALRAPDGRAWSWHDYAREVRTTAAALTALGLRRGDVVACWIGGRPEFHIADAAAMHLGVTSFSLPPGGGREHAEAVLADAGARVLVTEPRHVEAAVGIRDRGRTALEHIVCVDGDAPQALGWDELLGFATDAFDFDFDAAWQRVGSGDLATLVYAPAAAPRGVELTHANITAQSLALAQRLGCGPGTHAVAVLPPAHAAGRVCGHYLPMAGGWTVSCLPDEGRATEAVAALRPGFLLAPPSVWQELRELLMGGADADERAAIGAAMERVRRHGGVQDDACDQRSLARAGLDEVAVAIAAGGPCPDELVVFWHACGVPLAQLYGMPETTGVATIAAPSRVRAGTLGTPLACDVRTTTDGEILVRGPVVMRGYRNRPAATAAALDDEGWLRCGDVGSLDGENRLRVGERAEEIVSASGVRMAPARIEATLLADAVLTAQACVIGDGRPFATALLTVDDRAARRFARELGVRGDVPEIVHHRYVLAAVRAEVAAANQRLPRAEAVRRFVVVGEPWPPGGDELTPGARLRRSAIAAKYAAEIEALYASHESADATGVTMCQVTPANRVGSPKSERSPGGRRGESDGRREWCDWK